MKRRRPLVVRNWHCVTIGGKRVPAASFGVATRVYAGDWAFLYTLLLIISEAVTNVYKVYKPQFICAARRTIEAKNRLR